MLLAGRCSQWQSRRFQDLEPSPDRTHVHSVMDWSTQMLQRHVSSSFLSATWQASKFIDQKRIPCWKKNQTEKEHVLSDWTWAPRIIWHAPWQGKWVRTHHYAKATIEPFWADSWEAPPWIKCTPCPPPQNSVNWGSTGCKTNKNRRNRAVSRPGALDKLCHQHPRRSIMIWNQTYVSDCLWAASIHTSRFVSEFPMILRMSLVFLFFLGCRWSPHRTTFRDGPKGLSALISLTNVNTENQKLTHDDIKVYTFTILQHTSNLF